MNEINTDNSPKPATIESTKKILHQMENNICKIYTGRGKGTGFFVKISHNNSIIPVMITNYHILDEQYLKDKKEIKITISDNKKILTINLNEKRTIYCNEDYDTAIIEIKPEKDKIDDFMELDDDIFQEDSNILYDNESIYIIHYPNTNKVSVSYSKVGKIEKNEISHYCYTDKGSSGSPIINLSNNKIIGIHKKGSIHFKTNYGTYLKDPINEFTNKYIENNKIGNIPKKESIKENIKKSIHSRDNKKKEVKSVVRNVSHIYVSFYINIFKNSLCK